MAGSVFPEGAVGQVKILCAESPERLEKAINQFMGDRRHRIVTPVRVRFGAEETEPYVKNAWYATLHYYVEE